MVSKEIGIRGIEEHGYWNENKRKWTIIYIFPRKYIMTAFIKHVKKLEVYDRKYWKIDECHKLYWDRYFKRLAPRLKFFVCYQWYKGMNHVGLEFNDKIAFQNFVEHAKKFHYDNVVFESYLKCM